MPCAPDSARLQGALAGLRVLDFSRVFAGPYCSMLLADLGAEVLKIERPGLGDDTRAWGPPFHEGESAYYLCLNRNKHSLCLNLDEGNDRERAHRLALRADVLLENFRVGWMAGRGLDAATLRAANPGLIYCSISGYGQDGPAAQLPGYDFLIQGQSGLMSITGPVEGEPCKVGVAVADLVTGLHAAVAILAALHRRGLTGEGAVLDLSLLECQVAGLANVAAAALLTGRPPQRHGNAHPHIAPYASFAARDGMVLLAVGNDAQWCRCCHVLGRPELATDARFARNEDRVRHREALAVLLHAELAERDAAEWVQRFRAAGVPAALPATIPEALEAPQLLARGLLGEVGGVSAVLSPLLRADTPRGVPPRLGEGGEEVAARWLGEG